MSYESFPRHSLSLQWPTYIAPLFLTRLGTFLRAGFMYMDHHSQKTRSCFFFGEPEAHTASIAKWQPRGRWPPIFLSLATDPPEIISGKRITLSPRCRILIRDKVCHFDKGRGGGRSVIGTSFGAPQGALLFGRCSVIWGEFYNREQSKQQRNMEGRRRREEKQREAKEGKQTKATAKRT